ncbi:hypothetical protein ACSBR1_034643 [Camellia fascicularis]
MEGGSQQNIGHYSPSYLPIDDCFNFDLPNPTVPKFHWTQDFHYRFVECVNLLGGADKATPKTILKLMDTEGLKIYDVKSHLQQYRIAKYMKESEEGRSEKMTCVSEEAHTDALQMQLDVQRQIHEQLETQRILQLQTEEQRRQLQMIFDLQQNYKNGSLIEKQNPISTCLDDLSSSVDDMSIADDSRKNNSKCI